ncbi:MAG: potassium channel family protein [Candidatus Gracilibacteria bacterium]|nr:potassium channel family protein [Candidatus Gracilibacteria bacterium]
MKIQEAIEFIENFEVPEKLENASKTIKDSLVSLDKDEFEDIATHYYYLLRVVLKSHILFEKDIARYYYRKMTENFRLQEEKYKRAVSKSKQKEVIETQLDIFYQMMERYYSSLEVIYDKKDFIEAKERAYREKMNFRKSAYRFSREYMKYLGYEFLAMTSSYGTSFFRWGITSLIFILIFAGLFACLNYFHATAIEVDHWYDYIYFSITTFATLGYGDISPISLAGKILSNIEVSAGYIMLGIFMGLVQKRIL